MSNPQTKRAMMRRISADANLQQHRQRVGARTGTTEEQKNESPLLGNATSGPSREWLVDASPILGIYGV